MRDNAALRRSDSRLSLRSLIRSGTLDRCQDGHVEQAGSGVRDCCGIEPLGQAPYFTVIDVLSLFVRRTGDAHSQTVRSVDGQDISAGYQSCRYGGSVALDGGPNVGGGVYDAPNSLVFLAGQTGLASFKRYPCR